MPTVFKCAEGNTPQADMARLAGELGGVGEAMHARKRHGRESGDPAARQWRLQDGPHGEPQKGTAMTNGGRDSDSLVVSGKPSNKACDNKQAAEAMAERRRLAKGNASKRNRNGTQCPKLLPATVSWNGYDRRH